MRCEYPHNNNQVTAKSFLASWMKTVFFSKAFFFSWLVWLSASQLICSTWRRRGWGVGRRPGGRNETCGSIRKWEKPFHSYCLVKRWTAGVSSEVEPLRKTEPVTHDDSVCSCFVNEEQNEVIELSQWWPLTPLPIRGSTAPPGSYFNSRWERSIRF